MRGDKVFIEQMLAAARRSGLELAIRNADQPGAGGVQFLARETGEREAPAKLLCDGLTQHEGEGSWDLCGPIST